MLTGRKRNQPDRRKRAGTFAPAESLSAQGRRAFLTSFLKAGEKIKPDTEEQVNLNDARIRVTLVHLASGSGSKSYSATTSLNVSLPDCVSMVMRSDENHQISGNAPVAVKSSK